MPLLLTLTQGEGDKHFMCIQSCIFNCESEDEVSPSTPHQVHHQHHNTQTGKGDDKLEGEEGVEEGEDKEEDRQGRMEKKDRGEKIISEYNNIIEHEH